MKKYFILLLFLLSCGLLSAMEILPFAKKGPDFAKPFVEADWKNARKLANFKLVPTLGKPAEDTVLYLLRDKNTLYIAAILKGENVPAFQKRMKGDLDKLPWALPGMEMIFAGSNGSYLQLAIDYMGRIYSNLDHVFFIRTSYKKDQVILRLALPLSILPRTAETKEAVNINFYRKAGTYTQRKPVGVSSFFPNPKNNFMDFSRTTPLLLEAPGVIAQALAAEKGKKIDSFVKAGSLGKEDALKLQTTLAGFRKEALAGAKEEKKFFAALAKINQLDTAIVLAQKRALQKKYGFRKGFIASRKPHTSLPSLWKPAIFGGKDFHYSFVAIGIPSMEQFGLMELPFLRDALFYIRWDSRARKGFAAPHGEHYKFLQKYKNNKFAVKTVDRVTVREKERKDPSFKALFDKEYMETFLKTYKGRFLGFWEDEAFANDVDVFRRHLVHYKLPLPRNREEAYEAFKKCYHMKVDDVPARVPFRNMANMSRHLKGYVGNSAAIQLNHMVHAQGDLLSGNENGDCMGATPPKVAFARGAARQYGKAWRNYQTYYGWAKLFNSHGGMRCATKSGGPWVGSVEHLLTPDCRKIAYCYLDGMKVGLGLERQKATHLYPFMSGVGVWNSEADLEELTSVYELDNIYKTNPLIINLRDQKLYLSPMGKIIEHFYNNIVMKRDRGVSITPIAAVFDRAHGYLPLYFGGRVWDFFNPTDMEKTMWAWDHHIFRRVKQHPAYATSSYGDIFDVITNDSSLAFLKTYKVIYPVGDVKLDKKFAKNLISYVKNGGTLIINTALLAKYKNAFPASFLGCQLLPGNGVSPATYLRLDGSIVQEKTPYTYNYVKPTTGEVIAVTTDLAQKPAILVNKVGKGRVIVTTPHNMKQKSDMKSMLNLFDSLMRKVAQEVMPLTVRTPMQFMVNRSKTSYLVYLQNNSGLPPGHGIFTKPVATDVSKVEKAEITLPAALGKVKKVMDWWTGKEVSFRTVKGKTIVNTTLPGGDCQVLEFVMK